MYSKLGVKEWRAARATESDFEAVYRLEYPRVFNFFWYRTGDDALSDDLTSATFERAWRYRDRYRRDLAAFSTWLFTIARRVAADHFRHHRNEVGLDSLRELASAQNTELTAEQRLDFARLLELLQRLPQRDQELVALRYGAGLTNQAIGHLMGLTESNVGVILHRALQNLRSQWET